MAIQIQIRRDLAATWTSVNPTPAQGEICLETDTLLVKVGSGLSTWVNLPYFPAGGGASVTSTELSAVSAAARSAINIVSNALSNEISNRISADNALSTAVNVVSNAASNALSVANAASNAASVVSAAVNALSVVVSNRTSAIVANSAQMTSADNAISAAVNVVSNALSNETSNRISAINVVSNAASNALSVANAASNAASIVSQALSVQAAILSNLVSSTSSMSTKLSNTTSAVVANSAQMTSADNAISNRLSATSLGALKGVSVPAPVDGHVLMWNSAQGQWIDSAVAAGTGSVTSAELVDAVSVETANRISAVNVVSNAASNALSVANAASNAASIVSQALSVQAAILSNLVSSTSSMSTKLSNTTSAVVANSAQMTSANNAISAVAANAISIGNAVSNRLSTWTLGNLANVSVPAPNDGDVLKWRSASAQWVASVDNTGGGGASVTSAEYQSLVDRVSANSGTGGAASVTSAEFVAAVPWPAAVIRIMSTLQSTNGSALVDISGLVLTVEADETWAIDGMFLFSTSATTVGLRLGTSAPPLSTPRAFAFSRYSGGQSGGIAGGAGQLQVSGSSANMSITGTGPAGGVCPVVVKAVFNVTSAGTFRFQFAGIASTAASPMHILPGSYFKAFRLK